jgi:hypothetical protein
MRIKIYVYVHIYMHRYINIHTHIHVYIYFYVEMVVCLFLCWICICIYICIEKRICILPHIHQYLLKCMYSYSSYINPCLYKNLYRNGGVLVLMLDIVSDRRKLKKKKSPQDIDIPQPVITDTNPSLELDTDSVQLPSQATVGRIIYTFNHKCSYIHLCNRDRYSYMCIYI